MRKISFLLFLVNILVIHAVKIKEIESVKIMDDDNSIETSSCVYSPLEKCLFIATSTNDTIIKIAHNSEPNVNETARRYLYYPEIGELHNVELKTGFSNGAINMIEFAQCSDDTLFLKSNRLGRVNAYRMNKGKLDFSYSIDIQHKARYSVFTKLGQNLYLSGCSEMGEHDALLGEFKIVADTDFEESMNIEPCRAFISEEKYSSMQGDSLLKKLKKYDSLSVFIKDVFQTMFSECAYQNIFVLEHNNRKFAVNSYGIDILEIDQDTVTCISDIDVVKEMRKADNDIINSIKINPFQNNKYSHVKKVFNDEFKNVVMLYYQRSDRIKEISKDPADYLIIKYLKKSGKRSERKLALDFIPVHYDQNKRIFHGLKNIEGEIYYVKYKLKV